MSGLNPRTQSEHSITHSSTHALHGCWLPPACHLRLGRRHTSGEPSEPASQAAASQQPASQPASSQQARYKQCIIVQLYLGTRTVRPLETRVPVPTNTHHLLFAPRKRSRQKHQQAQTARCRSVEFCKMPQVLAPGVLSPNFTEPALLGAIGGGILIGAGTIAKLWLNGNILGFSGIASGLVKPGLVIAECCWRLCFLLGVPAGGLVLRPTQYEAFESLPTDGTALTRFACAGLLVGVGTTLGNGCTSGHGISGITRLSKRSFAATATFMVTGAASASVFSTASWLEQIGNRTTNATQTEPVMASTVSGVVFVLLLLLTVLATPNVLSKQTARLVVEASCGMVAGCALGISGMAKPTKVAGFLDFSRGLHHWDPTLPFVMAGALCTTLPCYQLWLKGGSPRWGDSFALPTNTKVDLKLLAGAALFGVGWGVAGICPGPSFVGIAGADSIEACGPWFVFMVGLFSAWGLTPRLLQVRSKIAPNQSQVTESQVTESQALASYTQLLPDS